jgi:phospholipid/cholesterol/gamma-HCH transport system substrate-binding protein
MIGRRNPRGPRRATLTALGLVTLALLAAFLYVGFTAAKHLPFVSYYYVRGTFANAENIGPQDQVRMGGVRVGQVAGTGVLHGQAVVRLQLDHGVAPLRSDTRLSVRPLSAVGTRFVEITPGTRGTPLPSDALIPASQTSADIPLTDLFDVFNRPTQLGTQQLFTQLGVGFAGRGEDAGTALAEMPPTLSDLSSISQTIDAQGGLRPLIAGAQSAAAATDPVRATIAQGFGTEQRALAPFVQQASALEATLTEAAPTLQTFSAELPPVSGLLAQVESFSRAAVPALNIGRTAFTQTALLLRRAQPDLQAVPGAVSLIGPATPPLLHLLAGIVEPVLPHFDMLLSSALPLLGELAPRGCDMHEFASNWADILSWGDSFSDYLRYDLVSPDETSIGGYTGPRVGIYSTAYPAPCQVEHQQVP